jgi:hypothetical protein
LAKRDKVVHGGAFDVLPRHRGEWTGESQGVLENRAGPPAGVGGFLHRFERFAIEESLADFRVNLPGLVGIMHLGGGIKAEDILVGAI